MGRPEDVLRRRLWLRSEHRVWSSIYRLLFWRHRHRWSRAHAWTHRFHVRIDLSERVWSPERVVLGHHGDERRVLLPTARKWFAARGLPAGGGHFSSYKP